MATRIARLEDSPYAIDTLERLFIEEWAPWYGPDGKADARSDLECCVSARGLPICIVAFNRQSDRQGERQDKRQDRIVGTASLKWHSAGSEFGIGPWLAALLVRPDARSRGIGSLLVSAIEREASLRGFSEIFASTDTAYQLLRRRGWQDVATTGSLRGPLKILRRTVSIT